VVPVRMADKYGINRQARDIDRSAVWAERKTYIEKNRCFSRGDLDTGSTNFLATLKNGDVHRPDLPEHFLA